VASLTGEEYLNRVREEVATLEDDLAGQRVRARIQQASRGLGVPDDLGLAAIYRAARRSGLTLTQFLGDLEQAIAARGTSPPGQT